MNKLLLFTLFTIFTLAACQVIAPDEPTPVEAKPAQQRAVVDPNQDPIRITDTFRDYGVDQNQDGFFETLVVEVEVHVTRAGEYSFGGTLSLGTETKILRDIDGVQQWLYLDAGIQSVPLPFGGNYIARAQKDGPYQLNNLWITDIQNPTPIQLRGTLLDVREIAYITSGYTYGQFEVGE